MQVGELERAVKTLRGLVAGEDAWVHCKGASAEGKRRVLRGARIFLATTVAANTCERLLPNTFPWNCATQVFELLWNVTHLYKRLCVDLGRNLDAANGIFQALAANSAAFF